MPDTDMTGLIDLNPHGDDKHQVRGKGHVRVYVGPAWSDYIDIHIHDFAVEVRGMHWVSIEPRSSNSLTVHLLDPITGEKSKPKVKK